MTGFPRAPVRERGSAAPAATRAGGRIEIQDVMVRFRGGVEALRSVSLSVGEGELVAIVGPSGCGKSTLLNAVAGLLDPAEVEVLGSMRVDGVAVEGRTARRAELGYVFQRDALLPWQTILENVQVGLVIRRMPRAEREDRARTFIDMAGLSGFEHYYPHQVSGGMRQRASLIRTLAYDPPVILMDEPFGALDAQNRILLQGELLRLWERTRKTILFVTHDLAEAIVLAQRVVLMSKRPGQVKREYAVDLPAPRDPLELRGTQAFADLEATIWQSLRDEFREAAPAGRSR